MFVSNPGSALGQAVGKAFEQALVERLRPEVERRGCSIGPARMKNGTDNVYQIDGVIWDCNHKPLLLLDPKYIRYTKHNRDKGSWLCTAHYNLRKTHPTIRKTIAILAGRWSWSSIGLIESFGIEVLVEPFERMVGVVEDLGIAFDWNEKDRRTPMQSWERFQTLTDQDRLELGYRLTDWVMPRLTKSVVEVLDTDLASVQSRITEVEVLLKTDRNEMLLLPYHTVSDAMRGMMDFMSDRADIRDLLS